MPVSCSGKGACARGPAPWKGPDFKNKCADAISGPRTLTSPIKSTPALVQFVKHAIDEDRSLCAAARPAQGHSREASATPQDCHGARQREIGREGRLQSRECVTSRSGDCASFSAVPSENRHV